MQIKIAFRKYLEQRLSVEVDFIKIFICLIIDVTIGKTDFRIKKYPLAMIRP